MCAGVGLERTGEIALQRASAQVNLPNHRSQGRRSIADDSDCPVDQKSAQGSRD
jgi:hypothetical protein